MIVGMHDMLGSVTRYWNSRVSSEGALWILLMDGLFLIPLVFAAFFYPWPVLMSVAGVLLATALVIEVVHVVRTHRVGWRQHV
jgi:hypothetical protein